MINFRYNTCNPSPSKSDHFDLDKGELSSLESELNVLTSQYDCLSVMRSLNVSRYHYDQTCVCDCHNRVEASYDTRSPIGTRSSIYATPWINRCITDSEAEEKLSIVMMA
ncbi:hypothetical protein FOYG_10267 [Fusarium oxysporum NRRL 32931]|uniref:Uncharacterized protein n=1 Tax=Fusarium oxysporum NRRL 32931 TaxID=660029 RepID=W9I484_FUSOX|nr:hypothetical protein FOYG_10267 [Fusarium oxysporum NRRL 32931]